MQREMEQAVQAWAEPLCHSRALTHVTSRWFTAANSFLRCLVYVLILVSIRSMYVEQTVHKPVRYASCHDVQDQRPKTVARAILLCCEYSRSCPPMSDFRLISDVPPSISMGLRHNLAHKVFLCEGFFSVCTWVRPTKASLHEENQVGSLTHFQFSGRKAQPKSNPTVTGWPRKRMPHMVVSCDMELGGGVLDRYTNLTCETWAVVWEKPWSHVLDNAALITP